MTRAHWATHGTVSRYVALGDSYSASDTGAQGSGWPDAVAIALRGANPGLRCHNLARAGASSRDVVEEQVPSAILLKPDLVTLSCGVDEILACRRFDLGVYAAHVSSVLRTLRKELPGAAIVTTTYPDVIRLLALSRTSKAQLGSALRQVNSAIRSLARRHGIACADLALDRSICIDAASPSDVWRRQNVLLVEAITGAIAAKPYVLAGMPLPAG
jgi:hypothetical protein